MSKLRFLKINILFRGLVKFQSEIKADLMCEFEKRLVCFPNLKQNHYPKKKNKTKNKIITNFHFWEFLEMLKKLFNMMILICHWLYAFNLD